MSLARAFLQAGSRAVVGSLWRLRDDETRALVASFYRHLAEGMPVAGALASSRRDMIRQGAPATAWAGLVVLGDGDYVPLPGGGAGAGTRPLLLLAATAFLALLMALSWRALRGSR